MMMKKAENTVIQVLGWLLVVLMAVSVLNVLWQVFTRFVLRNPSPYTEELARFLLIWLGLLGSSYAASKKLHLAIDVVLVRFKGKTRDLAEFLIHFFVFLFSLSVMVIGGIRLVAITLILNQISAALHIKMGYVYLVLPLSGSLIMFFSLVSVLEKVQSLRGKTQGLESGKSGLLREE